MNELIPAPNQELVSAAPGRIDAMIAVWLDSKAGRSGSAHTEKIYRTTIADFRGQLHSSGLDLDADPRAIALIAQSWAGQNAPAPATFNRRLAVLSSFYAFCRKRGLDLDTPIGLVERRPVQSYAGIEALAPEHVRPTLASIDRSTLAGLRDYALLNVALVTGRRVAELAGMRWAHLHFDGDRIRLHFPRAKGGKVMGDTLPAGVARALTRYLHTLYGAELARQRPEAPIWVALSRNQPGRPPLSVRSLEQICTSRLGIHFHGLRHTFARTMEDAGAKVSDIQGRLGHSSLATTGRYLAALRASENPHAEQVAELLGLGA